jgi:hypothetical protein
MRHPFAAVLIACGLLASTVAQGLAENYGTPCWTDSRGRRTCQESREYNAAAKLPRRGPAHRLTHNKTDKSRSLVSGTAAKAGPRKA